MNIKGALRKAQELFGAKATVGKRLCDFYEAKAGRPPMCTGVMAHPQPCVGGLPSFSIGRVEMGMFNCIKGEGMTWEEAFLRAERSKHEDLCPKCIRRKPCETSAGIKTKADVMRDEVLAKLLATKGAVK